MIDMACAPSMPKPKSWFSKAYTLYKYNSPVGVMSANETVVFNSLAACVFSLFLYWLVMVFPYWLVRAAEATSYYLTGHKVPFSLAASVLVSSMVPRLHTPAPSPANFSRMSRDRVVVTI